MVGIRTGGVISGFFAALAACSPTSWPCGPVTVSDRLPPEWHPAVVRATATWAEALAPYGIEVVMGDPGDIRIALGRLNNLAGETYISFALTDGDIQGATVRLNSDAPWSLTTACAGSQLDAEAVIAHELGHAFGLDHSEDPHATMYGTPSWCDVEKRSLSEDDLRAVQDVYEGRCH